MEEINGLEFDRSVLLGKGRYGSVFKGKIEKKKSDRALTVAVRRVEKMETIVDSQMLLKQNTKHPNVVRFYGTEESDVEFT
jgi:thiazole synthase ThiGH ThiG subunit